MSRNKEYTKKNHSALVGSPVGEFSIEIDMTTADAIENIKIHDEFSWPAQIVSCQIVSTALVGVLDGTVDLCQSNDGENYDLLSIQSTLNTANGSDTLEKAEFSGKFFGVKLAKTGITGGTVKLILIVKHR